MYKRLRPDLTDYDFAIWKEKYRLGEAYLNELKRRTNNETRRLSLIGHAAQRQEHIKYFEENIHQLSQPHIKGNSAHIERTWEEASKIVAYMTTISNRIQKYRLEYPLARFLNDANNCKKMEDEVCDRLVREMRKPPVRKEEESSE